MGVENLNSIDLSRPKWDQTTFQGRAKHFFVVTNPLNLLKSNSELQHARDVVLKHKRGETHPSMPLDELWKQKYIYDSAFHPDTHEKMLLIGRMSAQVPMNMSITGCMMAFHKSTPAVVFWQWINQSFNAIVNFTNRSGDKPISNTRLGVSYVCATGGALVTALGLNSLVKSLPSLIGRFVPFTAVAAANCINIPLMRSRELTSGIPVFSESGDRLGESTAAAKKAIPQVVFSRIGMAVPGMVIPPIVMDQVEKRTSLLRRRPWINAPAQVLLCGMCLVFATPLCCALFPQTSSLPVNNLESPLREKLLAEGHTKDVYFNKGL